MQISLTKKLVLKFNPIGVERGGCIDLSISHNNNQLINFQLGASPDSYFSLFELDLLETFFKFVLNKSFKSIEQQNFREIESFLRKDNQTSISKNDEEGSLLIEEMKNFLIGELLFDSLLEDGILQESLEHCNLVQKITKINHFLHEIYNHNELIIIFDQKVSLVNLAGDEAILSLEKHLLVYSLPLVSRVFCKKFLIKKIKLVAGHSLSR